MSKLNCWQAIRCGREPGGKNVKTLGICRAAEDGRLTGVNDGLCGGRVCWAVPNTHQLGVVTESLAGGGKLFHCLDCEFMRRVEREEGNSFSLLGAALDRTGAHSM